MSHARDRSGRPACATRRRVAAVLVTLVTLTGCSAPADRAAGTSSQSSENGAAPLTPAPEDRATDGAADRAGDCAGDVAALDAVITEQLAAFADDDWERAFALTSRRFRAGGIDADGLREIVTSGYAEAADAEGHEVLGCVRTGFEAQVLIEVTASDGATLGLVYLLTLEDGGWRVSGAVEHGTAGSEPATIPA